MAEKDLPQLYLITPPEFDDALFGVQLQKICDQQAVACLRVTLSSQDSDVITRKADLCREIAHAYEIAVVIDRHIHMVERLGLDGVHLGDNARAIRNARDTLGSEAIIGAFAHASRHNGMSAGEAGADYVSFGPISGADLGDGVLAAPALFEWWSEMIELPVIAEGGLTRENIAALAPIADFIALGTEIWNTPDPAAHLANLWAAIG